jgi:tryptophanyl-tRNA synthetase
MGFDDPTVKMSKSIGEKKMGHSIGILDPPDIIRSTIMSAVTDQKKETRFDHAGQGVLNLLILYEALSGEPRPAIETRFEGKGYGFLKKTMVELVVEKLAPVQRRYAEIASAPSYIERVLQEGADRVKPRAEATMDKVRRLTGLAERPSSSSRLTPTLNRGGWRPS